MALNGEQIAIRVFLALAATTIAVLTGMTGAAFYYDAQGYRQRATEICKIGLRRTEMDSLVELDIDGGAVANVVETAESKSVSYLHRWGSWCETSCEGKATAEAYQGTVRSACRGFPGTLIELQADYKTGKFETQGENTPTGQPL
ncbi:MAG: hypothetical protein AAGA56_17500 [Myxococcota bacterium]